MIPMPPKPKKDQEGVRNWEEFSSLHSEEGSDATYVLFATFVNIEESVSVYIRKKWDSDRYSWKQIDNGQFKNADEVDAKDELYTTLVIYVRKDLADQFDTARIPKPNIYVPSKLLK